MTATRTYGQACRALLELTLLLGSDAAAPGAGLARPGRAAYADLTRSCLADVRCAEHAVARLRKQITAGAGAATDALTAPRFYQG